MIMRGASLRGREDQEFGFGEVRFEMPMSYANGGEEQAVGKPVWHLGGGQTWRYDFGIVDLWIVLKKEYLD